MARLLTSSNRKSASVAVIPGASMESPSRNCDFLITPSELVSQSRKRSMTRTACSAKTDCNPNRSSEVEPCHTARRIRGGKGTKAARGHGGRKAGWQGGKSARRQGGKVARWQGGKAVKRQVGRVAWRQAAQQEAARWRVGSSGGRQENEAAGQSGGRAAKKAGR